jgi:hypothetical protein
MCVNGKIISVETIPGIRGSGDEEWWRGEFKYNIFHIFLEFF